jgi:tetratricopeptide (TPR) repeat protein
VVKRDRQIRVAPRPFFHSADRDCIFAGAICILLAAAVWITFGQTLRYEFVNYDDDRYVYDNPDVNHGLTLAGLASAFTRTHVGNWHPLTMISHMLDCQLYRLRPWGHHLTNVWLHAAAAIVLFLALRHLTGAFWRSAFVAAVFAVHPLRAESVAWVAERKDVLSGLFFMLTLWAYSLYTCIHPRSARRYTITLILFALGLMCKATLVPLPFILLLLDYWPGRRFRESEGKDWQNSFTRFRHLLVEKIPFLALAAAACLATILAQRAAIAPTDQLSFADRIGNALVSYVIYLGQMFYPVKLAAFYPYLTDSLTAGNILLSSAVLVGITAIFFFARANSPYLLVGWLWYLGMLVPVIGIIQVGSQARADRYTYLPQIGLYLLVTWTATDLSAKWRYGREILVVVASIVILTLIISTQNQTSYWKNSETLWTHTLACTSRNSVAEGNLGAAVLQKGQVDKAIPHFQKALEIKPNYAEAESNLGVVFLQKRQPDNAMPHFQKALEINPHYAEAESNLGAALLQKGEVDGAIAHCVSALEIKPDCAEAHYNFGNALLQKGQMDEATTHYQEALKIRPRYAEAYNNLGVVFLRKGQLNEAINYYQQALTIKPDYAPAKHNLGDALLQKDRLTKPPPKF